MRSQLALGDCLAVAIRIVHSHRSGLWVNDPNFFRAVCEVLLRLQIEPGWCVRVRDDLDGDSRRPFVAAIRSGRANLGCSDKANIGLQPSVGR